ncbi:Uncharacterised protein [Rodentibacter pneumotropicus]|uniref:Uncharacterized protein n=1 Tax=Rodentibacter pneumotropicus TaxID=758 RepID=A0A3S4U0Q7_9PAST|nr:Uncharacterised protein [Rodentibacter pneumotropicus]
MSQSSLEEHFLELATYTRNEIERLQQEKELTDELLIELVSLLTTHHAFPLSELEKIFQKRLAHLQENTHHNEFAYYNAMRLIHRLRMAVACELVDKQTHLLKHRDKTFQDFEKFRTKD